MALVAFKNNNGHCNVPNAFPENRKLGEWVSTQRKDRGAVSPERIARLDALGFAWDPIDAAWEEMFAALGTFKNDNGHCNVPARYPENPMLGGWVSRQRRSKGTLSADRIAQLDALGFVWAPLDVAWEEMFTALVAFKNGNGHCNVPQRYPENRVLAAWTNFQRQSKQRGTLSAERIARLDGLGLVWDLLDAAWNERFAALLAFRTANGDCNVSQQDAKNRVLGTWIGTQRQSKQRGTLSADRIAQLDALGFVWDMADAAWNEVFAALTAYRRQHGDCNVPRHYSKNRVLGEWVHTQRRSKQRGSLSAERIALLDAQGVVWEPGKRK